MELWIGDMMKFPIRRFQHDESQRNQSNEPVSVTQLGDYISRYYRQSYDQTVFRGMGYRS